MVVYIALDGFFKVFFKYFYRGMLQSFDSVCLHSLPIALLYPSKICFQFPGPNDMGLGKLRLLSEYFPRVMKVFIGPVPIIAVRHPSTVK